MASSISLFSDDFVEDEPEFGDGIWYTSKRGFHTFIFEKVVYQNRWLVRWFDGSSTHFIGYVNRPFEPGVAETIVVEFGEP